MSFALTQLAPSLHLNCTCPRGLRHLPVKLVGCIKFHCSAPDKQQISLQTKDKLLQASGISFLSSAISRRQSTRSCQQRQPYLAGRQVFAQEGGKVGVVEFSWLTAKLQTHAAQAAGQADRQQVGGRTRRQDNGQVKSGVKSSRCFNFYQIDLTLPDVQSLYPPLPLFALTLALCWLDKSFLLLPLLLLF